MRWRACGFLEESVWSPRGIHRFISRGGSGVENSPEVVEQLEDDSRMNLGQISGVHSRVPFILETLHGHPHGTTRSDLRIRANSTDSTVPITTAISSLEEIS